MNTEETQPILVPLSRIDTDPALQMRDGQPDREHIETLASVLGYDPETGKVEPNKTDLDPATLYLDGQSGVYFIGDGWHRRAAYQLAERKEMPAIVFPGGRQAAFTHALGANADQRAKPRSRKDIERAVIRALEELRWGVPADEVKADEQGKIFTMLPPVPKNGKLESGIIYRTSHDKIAELCQTTKRNVINKSNAIEKAAIKAATAPEKQPAVPVVEVGQLDFFGILNKRLSTVLQDLDDELSDPIWIDSRYSDADRLKGIEASKAALKERISKLTELENAIRENAPKA